MRGAASEPAETVAGSRMRCGFASHLRAAATVAACATRSQHALYNEPLTVRHHGPLDVRVLEQALSEIVRRHEAWRTTFPVGRWRAHATGAANFFYRCARKSTTQSVFVGKAKSRLCDLAAPMLASLSILSKGPLFRAKLVRLGEEEHRLYITLHHLIFDGFSGYRVFLPELVALYEAFSRRKPSPLPELPFQFGDYAVRQRERVQSGALDAAHGILAKAIERTLPSLHLPLAGLLRRCKLSAGRCTRFRCPRL